MKIEFDKDYLSELYYNGKASDKKHRFQPSIIKKYIRVIDTLIAAESTEELYRFKSLNYEVLVGNKKGIESVRVNDCYRIEFISEKIVDKTVVTICNILDLTKHYE